MGKLLRMTGALLCVANLYVHAADNSAFVEAKAFLSQLPPFTLRYRFDREFPTLGYPPMKREVEITVQGERFFAKIHSLNSDGTDSGDYELIAFDGSEYQRMRSRNARLMFSKDSIDHFSDLLDTSPFVSMLDFARLSNASKAPLIQLIRRGSTWDRMISLLASNKDKDDAPGKAISLIWNDVRCTVQMSPASTIFPQEWERVDEGVEEKEAVKAWEPFQCLGKSVSIPTDVTYDQIDKRNVIVIHSESQLIPGSLKFIPSEPDDTFVIPSSAAKVIYDDDTALFLKSSN